MGKKGKKQYKNEATELALLLYDIYKEAQKSDNMQKGQNDASKSKNN